MNKKCARCNGIGKICMDCSESLTSCSCKKKTTEAGDKAACICPDCLGTGKEK